MQFQSNLNAISDKTIVKQCHAMAGNACQMLLQYNAKKQLVQCIENKILCTVLQSNASDQLTSIGWLAPRCAADSWNNKIILDECSTVVEIDHVSSFGSGGNSLLKGILQVRARW